MADQQKRGGVLGKPQKDTGAQGQIPDLSKSEKKKRRSNHIGKKDKKERRKKETFGDFAKKGNKSLYLQKKRTAGKQRNWNDDNWKAIQSGEKRKGGTQKGKGERTIPLTKIKALHPMKNKKVSENEKHWAWEPGCCSEYVTGGR